MDSGGRVYLGFPVHHKMETTTLKTRLYIELLTFMIRGIVFGKMRIRRRYFRKKIFSNRQLKSAEQEGHEMRVLWFENLSSFPVHKWFAFSRKSLCKLLKYFHIEQDFLNTL